MKNFNVNCIFDAESVNVNNENVVGYFNASYNNGNICYSMNIIDAATNQDEVANDFDFFKQEVSNYIRSLTNAGFIVEKPLMPPKEEEV